MATSKDVYDLLFAEPGKRISITFSTRDEYETLRTSLHRVHRVMTDMDLTQESVCADWQAVADNVDPGIAGIGTFWLGKSRKRLPKHYFILSPTQNETQGQEAATEALREVVATNCQQHERCASESHMPCAISKDSNPSCAQREEQT